MLNVRLTQMRCFMRKIRQATRLGLLTAIFVFALSAAILAQDLGGRAKSQLGDARGGAALLSASSSDSFSVAKYIVRGVVFDDQAAPVEGVALHIGRQLAYTNSSGHFMLRLSKRASFPFSIALEESITNGVYQVVSAPSEVHSESEEVAAEVQVIVRRVPPPQAKLYNQ
jgi:hypothetical protein